eukprot:CAMPEP_0180154830 /NCGR_PEP_ID=MMETSP0986-20121125/24417_1 /TAXON_ID=697907 /ORGANISM="non described non described, Strain CCMP2293" /LENGTH=38 /DNA_ID= /DNA_START= /DNA_END= /DNA_ORIENTATION=
MADMSAYQSNPGMYGSFGGAGIYGSTSGAGGPQGSYYG